MQEKNYNVSSTRKGGSDFQQNNSIEYANFQKKNPYLSKKFVHLINIIHKKRKFHSFTTNHKYNDATNMFGGNGHRNNEMTQANFL